MSLFSLRSRWVQAFLLPGFLSCAFLGCVNASSPPTVAPAEVADGPAWFEDVTDAAGLDFVHDCGSPDTYFMPQVMGSGCAFIHDGDGTVYVYLLQNGGPKSKSTNRLYKKLADGRFRDVSEGSGLDIAGHNMGVAVADVNNDGLPDVLVTQFGGIRLFLNRGGGHFEDVTDESGLSNPLWATSAAFLDYNRDGWLDLVVINYLDYDKDQQCFSPRGERTYCTPPHFRAVCSKLFRNLGPRPAADGKPAARVHFEDVSFQSGIGRMPGMGLGVVCADFDGDGWPDIFVANDGEPNRLWINRHDGTFVDQAPTRGVAYTTMGKAYAGMGIALGDTTNDGLLDLFVTHLSEESNTLWKQGPPGRFTDRTAESGLAAARWRGTGFGALMADFDLDGSLDVAVVNGRVYQGGIARNTGLGFWEPYAERNQLFANDGAGQFRDLSLNNKAFCGRWNVARGLACSTMTTTAPPICW